MKESVREVEFFFSEFFFRKKFSKYREKNLEKNIDISCGAEAINQREAKKSRGAMKAMRNWKEGGVAMACFLRGFFDEWWAAKNMTER